MNMLERPDFNFKRCLDLLLNLDDKLYGYIIKNYPDLILDSFGDK